MTDSGIGIAPQMQQKILQPYVQADPNTPASTGLGLAICTQLVQLLGESYRLIQRRSTARVFPLR
nr:ATP-binding protein [Serratia odorifera]